MPRNERLRQRRFERNWRQQDVAEQLGVSLVTVQRWERGFQRPSAYYRVKLSTLFGLSAQELGLLEEPPPVPVESEARDTVCPDATPSDEAMLWMVPARNPHFTGRDELLERLEQHLSPQAHTDLATTRRAVLTQPLAIKGLGGVGKTQIAVEYAHRSRECGRYVHTLWINAASEETILASFVSLVERLPAFAAKSETNQHKLVAAVKRWLEQCPHSWLLVFDNADDVSLIQEYVPRQGNGSLLLTTRADAVGSLATPVEVETMSFVEGTQLLLRRAQRWAHASDEDINEAGNIVVALDHFPLALDQAGAYIEETGCRFSTYLQLYQDHRKVLLASRGRQATNYPDSVATTWSLSFQKVEQANPAAVELLQLCSFLAPDRIPEELIRDGAASWPSLLQQAAADQFAFNQMIAELLKFSLVKRIAEDNVLCMHRLVQAVQVDRMKPEEQRQWAERIICAVNTAFPRHPREDITSWPQCLRYLEQAQACDTLIQHHLLTLPKAADLLRRVGTYLCERASYTLAEPLYQRALAIREQQLGPEHPDTAESLNDLAILYSQQGKYEQAESLLRHALAIREKQLGAEHVDTIHTCNDLALLYWFQGKCEQAEPLLKRGLTFSEQEGEHEDVTTAETLNHLALLNYYWGKYEQAEPLFQRAVRIFEQTLGSKHPYTTSTLTNLGLLYKWQGKYGQAESFLQQALTLNEQTLGPEHPQTTNIMHYLGSVYTLQGRYTQAEPLLQRALMLSEQTLGPDHPDLIYVLDDLAEFYYDQGKYEQAESLLQRAVALAEQSLPPEHPDNAYITNHLARTYIYQRRYALAKPLLQRALALSEQSLGSQHPDTIDILVNLSLLYSFQDQYEQAEPLLQRALALSEQSLGPEHPNLAKILIHQAQIYKSQSKYEQTEPLLQRALVIREKLLGPEHPHTVSVRESYHALIRDMR